jgi:uncharacterized phage infection (PIP) family protein YhgE
MAPSNHCNKTIDKTYHHSRRKYTIPTRSALDNTDLAEDRRNRCTLEKARENKQLQKNNSAMARHKTTTIATATLNQLKEDKLALESALAKLKENCAQLKEELNKSENSSDDKDEIIKELKSKLSAAMTLLKENASKGRPKKQNLNTELLGHVKDGVSKYLFRTFHFIEDDEDCEAATKSLVRYLPVALAMSEGEFIADYKGEVATAIGSQRNYTQGQARKAAICK